MSVFFKAARGMLEEEQNIRSIPRSARMGKNLLEKASVRLPKALPFQEGNIATKKILGN